MVKVERLGAGIHNIAKVTCTDHNGNNVFHATYLVTVQELEDPESEVVQGILDDIKSIKASNPKMRINTITMYIEDMNGEHLVFFDMDDCEIVLFNK